MISFVFSVKKKVFRKIIALASKIFGRDFISGVNLNREGYKLVRIGSVYGGWVIPDGIINNNSVCYCVGVGEDISFDLGLIDKYRCKIYAYDPTPRAIEYANSTASSIKNYHFFPLGIWDEDETIKFYAPANPEHVSHSIVNLQKTEHYFEADCRRLGSIMSANKHDRIDLLKLDIEGAEYKVLESLVNDNLDVTVLCVEYDELWSASDDGVKDRISRSVRGLIDYGYKLVNIDNHSNYTFIKQ